MDHYFQAGKELALVLAMVAIGVAAVINTRRAKGKVGNGISQATVQEAPEVKPQTKNTTNRRGAMSFGTFIFKALLAVVGAVALMAGISSLTGNFGAAFMFSVCYLFTIAVAVNE